MRQKVEEKRAKAESENRLITHREGEIRKQVAYFLFVCLFLSTYYLLPSIRDYYGPLSMLSAYAIGVWRTGNESL